MKKLVRFLFSMRFAIFILLVLVAACIAGSVLPQGYDLSYYTQSYPEWAAGAVLLFGLDDVFHAPWFVALVVLLCVNLLGCSLVRFPSLLRQSRWTFDAARAEELRRGMQAAGTYNGEARELFRRLGFRKITEAAGADGRTYLFADRHKAGLWGAWVTHLGMLLVIAGFGFGQIAGEEYTVYGVPGQTLAIGDTAYEVTIDDFRTDYREGGTVDQYTATLTVTDTASNRTVDGTASVNAPLSAFGLKFYQNSTGWAADVKVFDEDGTVLEEGVLCAGECLDLTSVPGVTVCLASLYPDYTEDEAGQPSTASNVLNNPAYLYRLYYQGQILGMNVLTGSQVITLDGCLIGFTNPRAYTLLQITRDPFEPLAAVGALLILAGLILAFYLRYARVLAVRGEDGRWSVYGASRKGGSEFIGQVAAACGPGGGAEDTAAAGPADEAGDDETSRPADDAESDETGRPAGGAENDKTDGPAGGAAGDEVCDRTGSEESEETE